MTRKKLEAVALAPCETLVRTPSPQLAEAPSSWVTRLALHQGAELHEILDYLGLPRRGDPDLNFLTLNLAELEERVGLPLARLQVSLKVLRNLLRVDPGGRRLLFRDAGPGQFRYCPLCFKEQTVPHVPVHWRIVTWRYCPDHGCLLDTGCPSCRAPTVLPANMVTAGPRSAGVAYLRECARCGRSLGQQDPCPAHRAGPAALSQGDWCLLGNGRASLAALYTGRMLMREGGRNLGLKGLRQLVRRGVLPHDSSWLDPQVVRQRILAAQRARRPWRQGENEGGGCHG